MIKIFIFNFCLFCCTGEGAKSLDSQDWSEATLPTVDILATPGRDEKQQRKDLFCYQCTGDNRDPLPVCDENFWSQATDIEKESFLVRCPDERNDYCVKKLTRGYSFVHTSRGCGGAPREDTALQLQRPGCATYGTDHLSTMCLCTKSRCNSATSFVYTEDTFQSLIASVLVVLCA